MASTSRTFVLGLVVAALAGGCSSLISAPGGSGSLGGSTAPAPADRLHAQAGDALERWAAAVRDSGGASITFTGDMTSQVGEWEPAVGENNKQALMAGMVVATTALSDDVPGKRQVRWTDGPTLDVKVLSARDALAALVGAAPAPSSCPECRPIQVREANLATALVETSSGPAEVPVWVFSLQGTAVRVTRVAVDGSVTVTPPPWNADDPPEGISIELALGTPESTILEVQFVGAVERGDKPCGADYAAEAVESDLAVVVIVTERAHKGDAGGCSAAGKVRTARADLAAPLGERAVLEVRQGLPVPVHAP